MRLVDDDHDCIETVAPSGDHDSIDIVVPSSYHCCNNYVVTETNVIHVFLSYTIFVLSCLCLVIETIPSSVV